MQYAVDRVKKLKLSKNTVRVLCSEPEPKQEDPDGPRTKQQPVSGQTCEDSCHRTCQPKIWD